MSGGCVCTCCCPDEGCSEAPGHADQEEADDVAEDGRGGDRDVWDSWVCHWKERGLFWQYMRCPTLCS